MSDALSKGSGLTLTDMFCGCGGSTTGAKAAGVDVRLAINHWRLAVESHNTNHPETDHDCADVSETNPLRYPPTTGLIASPECTNHSLAKGQRRTRLDQGDFFRSGVDPSAVRSRATMWDVVRFAEAHRYEFVIVENVVDVRRWALYEPWLRAMHALGYRHRAVYLNAMFAHRGPGSTSFAPQSRDRIYVCFWKKGNRAPDLDIRPRGFCLPCGAEVDAVQSWKADRTWGKYRQQYVYRCPRCHDELTPYYFAALNALDLSLPAERIGDREAAGKLPLRPKTRARIEYGLRKFGLRELVIRDMSTSGIGHRVRDAHGEPLPTQVGYGHSDGLLQPFLVETAYSHAPDARAYGADGALPAATSRASLGFVSPFLLANREGSPPRGLGDPLHTACAGNHEFVVSPEPFVVPLRQNGTAKGVRDALHTICASGQHHMLVGPAALLSMRGSRHFRGVEDALPTQVAASIQQWLVQSRPFLSSYYGKHQAADVRDGMNTLKGMTHLALIEAEGELPIAVDDCYFRMLQPHEMLAGQGFPPGYVVLGTKRDQVKQGGNANPPPTMELLTERQTAALA